jgi:magnesium chelatase subunit D
LSLGDVSPAAPHARAWQDAALAGLLFAIDPAGTGVALRAGSGAVRDQWLTSVRALVGEQPWRRLPLHIRDERLLGGLDLAATLQAGRAVAQRGVLADADGGVLLLAMAERLEPATVAKLASVIDRGEVFAERDGVTLRHAARFGVIALDEGAGDDELLAAALAERLAFALVLDGVSPREAQALAWGTPADRDDVRQARERLPAVQLPDPVLVALCVAAAELGVDSPRAVLQALRVARAHCAWSGRDEVDADDAAVAARLVLAPRATRHPTQEAEPQDDEAPTPNPPPPADPAPPEPPETPEAQPPPDHTPSVEPPQGALDERVLQAVLSALPPDLLSRLKAERAGRDVARALGKTGAQQKSGQRGRPIGARRGEPRAGQRLNVVETLRAAAPWQKLRRQAAATAKPDAAARRIEVRADDFHITRLRPKRQSTTIFAVDASGSSALHRLAEAKGAVELLLADCYVRRDQVAVIAFRGRGAELLLPPTRSLVRAKRALAGLPGGGGTPLAAALDAALALADSARRRGESPLVVLLTDGRANVALDGTGGRARAETDALLAAVRLRAAGVPALLIDTSPQPQAQASRLAQHMHATYLPLPQAGAQAVSQAVLQAVQVATRQGSVR